MSLRSRVLDGLTIALAVLALGAFLDRYRHRGEDRGRRSSTVAAEKELIGRRPALQALGAVGEQLDSALRARGPSRALLLLYSETCPACLATRPTWDRILAALGDSVGAHAVSGGAGSGPRDFFGSAAVRAWRSTSGAAVARAFEVPWVPVTLVLSPAGTIEFARIGVLDSTDADTLLALLRSSPSRWTN